MAGTKTTAECSPPLSLDRLRSAFARMLGPDNGPDSPTPARDADAPTPEGIVEALLFVGRSDSQPLTAETIADLIRDVSPAEVDEIVQRLEASYRREGAAYRVIRSASGYRLDLAEGLDRAADRLRGRVRTAKLSQAALETLSVVAYQQPVTAAEVTEIRGVAASGASLAQLVRLELIRREPPRESQDQPHFHTTDRLLRALGLASLDQLPRLAELDD